MTDPLADVIADASRRWWSDAPAAAGFTGFMAAAVRAHIAAACEVALDWIEAQDDHYGETDYLRGRHDATTHLRATLLGTDDDDRG